MTIFERLYLLIEPFYPPNLNYFVRRNLLKLAKASKKRLSILDVGGRKSHYTIGVPSDVLITDLPRETEVQHLLNLGINSEIINLTKSRRSNVKDIIYDDMTSSKLPENQFDCVVAVEVLEHVPEDEVFVREVCRVLKPGGTFLMTTPNGDFIPNDTNPDHIRHYKRQQLYDLLATYFGHVEVDYAVRLTIFRTLGHQRWTLKNPFKILISMFGNIINLILSSPKSVNQQAKGTLHLKAIATKKPNP